MRVRMKGTYLNEVCARKYKYTTRQRKATDKDIYVAPANVSRVYFSIQPQSWYKEEFSGNNSQGDGLFYCSYGAVACTYSCWPVSSEWSDFGCVYTSKRGSNFSTVTERLSPSC